MKRTLAIFMTVTMLIMLAVTGQAEAPVKLTVFASIGGQAISMDDMKSFQNLAKDTNTELEFIEVRSDFGQFK